MNTSNLNQNPLFLAACIITNNATQYAQDADGKDWTTKPAEAHKFASSTTAQRIAIERAGNIGGQAKIIDAGVRALPEFPLRLKFIPEQHPELEKVRANKTAWALWLLWKSGHIVDQHYEKQVLKIAERIDANRPANDGELRLCIESVQGSNFLANDVFNFAREALPYLTGEAEVETIHVDAVQ